MNVSRCAYFYQPKSTDDSMIISLIQSMTDKHLRWRISSVFIELENWDISGIINGFIGFFCLLKLNIRSKRNKRLPQRYPEPLSVPICLEKC